MSDGESPAARRRSTGAGAGVGSGVVSVAHALLAVPWALAVGPAVLGAAFALDRSTDLGDLRPVLGAVLGYGAVLWAFALGSWRRTRRMPRDARGRGRHRTLALTSLLHLPVLAGYGAALVVALERARDLPRFTFAAPSVLDAVPTAWLPALIGAGVVAAASWAVLLVTLPTTWFLLPDRLRAGVWLVVDTALAIAFAGATLTLPLEPPEAHPDAVALPATRLAVTTLFAVRLVTRLLPRALDAIEALGFRALVAARHLRAKKSGFLATIGTLSILAVALSSCSLTTTLSVMGGFRADLKRKILGNHAHVVVQGADGAPIEGWRTVLETVRGTEGVVAAAPFVGGEVMVTSASNLAGAVLRGVVPEATADVTDLRKNLVRGRLDYLTEPERLLDLPPEETGGLPPRRPVPDEPDDPGDPAAPDDGAGAGDGARAPAVPGPPKQEAAAGGDGLEAPPAPKLGLEDLFDEAPAKRRRRDVLPGIIVGRELARTLRLFVGDDVDVVSPLGDLGPAGPMPKSRPFRVAGIFYSGMYEYDMKYAYVDLAAGQRFLGTGDTVTGVEAKVDRIEDAPVIASALRARLADTGLEVQDWQQLNRNLFGALALERLAMFVALGIAIVVAGFCVFGTLTLMVQEKAREVAILKAMGADRRRIVAVFLVEGLLIGLFGAAAGLGLGFVTCFAAEHFGIRMNPEVYYIDRLPVHTDALEFTLVGVAAVVTCLVATVFPAVAASRVSPVDALRYE